MVTITAAMNGRIPAHLLAGVPGQRAGILLASDAAASFGRLTDDLRRTCGWTPYLNSAYRTVAQQNDLRARGLTSVAGGKSEHGLARAADVDGLGGFTGVRYAQFTDRAGAHGWYQPAWARNGLWAGGRQVQQPEPWHFEYDPARDTHPTGPAPVPTLNQEDDDMLRIAQKNGEKAIYVGNGVTRRKILNADDLADIRWRIDQGQLRGSSVIEKVDRIDWLGREVK